MIQTKAAFNGRALHTEAAPYLAEYISRKRLASLGFTSPISELDCIKAEIFCMIDTEIQVLQSQETKGKKANGKR